MADWGEIKKEEKKEVLFKPLKEEAVKDGYNVLVYGGFGTGKSYFALTAPAPVYVIDTEKGMRPLLRNFADKEIYTLNVFGSDVKETYENILNSLDELEKQIKEQKVKTIVFDSLTDLWETCQAYAKEIIWKIKDIDKVKQQWDWTCINKLYYKVLKRLLNMECNFIGTAREAEIYIGAGQPSGEFKPRAQKETEYWTGINLYMNTKVSQGNLIFMSKVDKCKENGKVQGQTFQNLTFDKLIEEVKK